MPNPSLDGIAAIGSYTSASVDANIDTLLALIPDPDTTSTSGAQAGGGMLDEMSPIAAAHLRIELAAIKAASAGGATSGQHTVTAGDAAANLVNIVTGLADLTLANVAVTVTRAGAIVTSDAVITEPSAGTIRIADGSTYNTTAGDLINWAVVA